LGRAASHTKKTAALFKVLLFFLWLASGYSRFASLIPARTFGALGTASPPLLSLSLCRRSAAIKESKRRNEKLIFIGMM
jgi:hypothetical protein